MMRRSIKRSRPAVRRSAAARSRRRGTAIMEFALISPVLLMLSLICLDFGRAPFYYIGVTNAARAAAGYASSNAYPINGAAQTVWSNQVLNAITTELQSHLGNRYDSTKLTYAISTPTSAQVNAGGYWTVSVTVTYAFQPYIKWHFFGYNNRSTISLSRTVVMQGTI